jgi:hypothetical protein
MIYLRKLACIPVYSFHTKICLSVMFFREGEKHILCIISVRIDFILLCGIVHYRKEMFGLFCFKSIFLNGETLKYGCKYVSDNMYINFQLDAISLKVCCYHYKIYNFTLKGVSVLGTCSS